MNYPGKRTNLKAPLAVMVFLLLATGIAAQPATPFRIVGYYSIDVALKASPKKIPFKRLTHVNLWFFNPDTVGNFTKDLSALKPFIAAAHRKEVKVLFSIAGGSPHPYYHRLLEDDHRSEFISNLITQTEMYNIDGIDVDIEGHDIDDNYEAFVVELADSLRHHNKLITAAIAMYYQSKLSDRALSEFDFVNIMSYDRTGPWRSHEPGQHASMEAAEEDVNYFGTVRNIPPDKMTLGVPFYGYGFGPELTSHATSMSFAQIINAYPGSEKVDAWRNDEGQTYYYNGIPTIINKTKLALDKASGIMIWQLRGDARGRKSLLKIIYKASHSRKAR